MPHLRALLAAAGLPPSTTAGDPEVSGVTADSRAVPPGAAFVAIAGRRQDGGAHAAAAVRAGAVAVIAERAPDPPVDGAVPVVIVANSRVALSALASALEGEPSRAMTIAGVTGTDGKTTTCTMLWAAWRAAGHHTGLVSTVDFRDGDSVVANTSRLTTMDAPQTQHRLAELRASGCTHVVLETSSHALALHRVDHVAYRLAVYTRVTSEHLEVHGDRAGYLAAKARLLSLVGDRDDGIAVLDRDDEFAYPVLRAAPVARRLTYSAAGAADADLAAEAITVEAAGVGFTARTPWGTAAVRLRLGGRFNVANALAALAAAGAEGAPLHAAVAGIEALERVPGRMELVETGAPFSVVIDYAHTAEALATVLAELRPATAGRLWVVFGSAGERDPHKRAPMGAVAAQLADVVVVTEEDARGEDSAAICEEIAAAAATAGARRGRGLHVIPDRAEAIAFAIAGARPGDVVLCAGKGHETSIESAGVSLPWDERAVVEAALHRRD